MGLNLLKSQEGKTQLGLFLTVAGILGGYMLFRGGYFKRLPLGHDNIPPSKPKGIPCKLPSGTIYVKDYQACLDLMKKEMEAQFYYKILEWFESHLPWEKGG